MSKRDTCPCGDGPRPGHPDGWCGQGAPKTVRVRIAVAVYPDGWFTAWGQSGQDDATMAFQVGRHGTATDGPTQHWIEADVPLPLPPQTISGVALPCPDGLLPDGTTCPQCGGERAPSGIDSGTWVHFRGAPC